MEYINVKAMADEILDQVAAIPNKTKALAIISVGDDPASKAYMRGKIKDCERCGIPHVEYHFDGFLGVGLALEMAIRSCNLDSKVGGIILQLPLPRDNFSPSDEDYYTRMIDPRKDVDGFVPGSRFKPCTPEGIVHIMKSKLGQDLTGKEALIIGRGKLVGAPLHDMLQNDENMTVLNIHSKTSGAEHWMYDESWDAIIVATGKPGTLHLEDAAFSVCVDAGITRGEDCKLHGDCIGFDPGVDGYWGTTKAVTPVPGGVGLMTRAMLMKHMGEVQ